MGAEKTAESEITRIFNEYRMKLDELDKKQNERYPIPLDKPLHSSINSNYPSTAETPLKRRQESRTTP